MVTRSRWDPCIEHRGAEVDQFISEFFCDKSRNILFVSGAGFDPRATVVCGRIAAVAKSLFGLLIQEERPNPNGSLATQAAGNVERLKQFLPRHKLLSIQIFGSDNAVVGGRNVTSKIHEESLDEYTDIVVDISALSVGISYPIIKYFVERVQSNGHSQRLHVFVSSDPAIDEAIMPIAGDMVGFVHGFKGGWALDSSVHAAKLWLPQLAKGRNAALQRIYDFVVPHDTCPIFPFPAKNPRLGDELAEQYLTELENTWRVDTRNLVYAAEDHPLDLYRTLLRIDDRRQPVYKETGGSLLVLSPMGSKVLALGALMAALERDFPVVYTEAIGYEFSSQPDSSATESIHILLEGDVCPKSPNGY